MALPTENEDQGETPTNVAGEPVQETGSIDDDMDEDAADQEEAEQIEEFAETLGDGWRKRQVGGIVDDITTAVAASDDESTEDSGDWTETLSSTMAESDSSTSTDQVSVPVYSGPITYAVPKTGYYCVGIVPVTLVNSRDDQERRATHAEYSGMVLFRNNFAGELPAVEYPKIHVSF